MVRSNRYAFEISAPLPGTASIRVESYNSSTNAPISGMWTVLKDSAGNILKDGVFSPVTFPNLTTGRSYVVEAHSFGDTNFTRWDNGSQNFVRTIANLQGDLLLKAYYNVATVPPPPPPPPSGAYLGSLVFLYESAGTYNHASTLAVIATHNRYPKVPIIVMINHASGHVGGGRVASNVVEGGRQLANAGIPVVAYVHTKYNDRPMNEVKADMQVWKRDCPYISGFFWDEQNNQAGGSWYTKQLWDYAKSIGAPLCIGNPGTDTQTEYLDTAEILCIYETNGFPSSSVVTALRNKWGTQSRGRVAFIPCNEPNFNESWIRNAAPGVKWMYWTQVCCDWTQGCATWNSLSRHFENIIASMDKINREVGSY